MAFLESSSLATMFKIFCFVTTLGIICYWFYEYAIIDEDLSLVFFEEKRFLEYNDLPVVSICLNNPFLENRIRELDASFNTYVYEQYLSGNITDHRLHMIDFNNVTIQPSDIFFSGEMLGKYLDPNFNKSEQKELIRESLIQTFSGYINKYGAFFKCFGMPMSEKYFQKVDELSLKFLSENFLQFIREDSSEIAIIVHYPKQILLSSTFIKIVEMKPSFTFLEVDIRETEIIQQRMKPEKCLTSWNNFDASVFERHVKETGCHPPYLLSDNKSQICDTKPKIERSRYVLRTAGDILLPPPCRRMTSANYEAYALKAKLKEYVTVKILFPKEVKIIRQTKAVNFQSFIGNVGGYIGLILGNNKLQIDSIPYNCIIIAVFLLYSCNNLLYPI